MKYTNEDKKCSHCSGEIQAHCCGDKIIYWCKNCGSNDKECPPNISIKISK